MKKLEVHSLPLKDVITDIAKALNTEYSEDCSEYKVEIPLKWGNGSIKGINFDGGLGLLIYECVFHTDMEIKFTVNQTHPVKFLFCLEGGLAHHFDQDRELHVFQKYQNIIVASKGYNGHVLRFQKDIYTEIYSLELDRQIFNKKMSCELAKTKPNLRKIFQDQKARESFYYNGMYSLFLAELFDEMKSQNDSPIIKKLILESQSYRMLVQQLIQYDDDFYGISDKSIVRKSEANAIKQAVEIMKSELDSISSVNSIAQRVGLNQKKFQNGFRHYFGKSANEYLQSLRLNLAKDLLINTDDSLQEIKEKVGLSSQSYFTEFFKKKYHSTPSVFRIENRKNRNKK